MTTLFLPARLLTKQERRVIEAALRLQGHRSLKQFAESKDLPYDSMQKALSQQRPPGHLADTFSEVVIEAGLDDRLSGGGIEASGEPQI